MLILRSILLPQLVTEEQAVIRPEREFTLTGQD